MNKLKKGTIIECWYRGKEFWGVAKVLKTIEGEYEVKWVIPNLSISAVRSHCAATGCSGQWEEYEVVLPGQGQMLCIK